MESEILGLESGIQHKESGIPLTIGIQNPSSTGKESGFQYPESGINMLKSIINRLLFCSRDTASQ